MRLLDTMGVVPLIQVKLSKEPLAAQVRMTVLLCSMASGRLDVMDTLDTGTAGKHKNTQSN